MMAGGIGQFRSAESADWKARGKGQGLRGVRRRQGPKAPGTGNGSRMRLASAPAFSFYGLDDSQWL
ncbi:MAG: hypothetical protein NZ959_09050 [Armatimonadetes bacterium]|nr:hypothetical protein [Armatimonadota bacterium]MDW8123029.1 hypothetical protein [Armatimonadota bacterium]